jgi:hypothetical protein
VEITTGFVATLILQIVVYGSVIFMLTFGWIQWLRRPQLVIPSLVGFALASASALLAIGSVTYAQFIAGFRYYDPVLLKIYRLGFLLSAVGVVFGLFGIRRTSAIRTFAPALSGLMLLTWLIWAAGE